MVKSKGEVVAITKNFDDMQCKIFYAITVEFEVQPNLKIGECVVVQN